MRRVIAILLTLTIVFFVSGCAGISYYFQPNANPNVKWSTEDGVVWFVLDGKSDSAEIKGIRYYVRFNNADRMSFSDDDNWIRISFSCKFKKNKIIATVGYDEYDILGIGTELIFYKYSISEE